MLTLKKQLRASMSSDHATHLHRSISWLQCADKYADDDDMDRGKIYFPVV